MAIPSGLASQLGVAVETSYGVVVTPAAFFEFDSESMGSQPNFLTSSGLRAGRMSRPVGRHKQTTRDGGGSVTMKVPNKGFGKFLNLLHGNTVTPAQQGATAAYLQTHNIGTTAPIGKSLTMQIGKPDVAGVVQPFTYPGSKVTQAAFSMATGGELMVTLDIDANDEITSTGLATASYPSGLASLDFTGGNVTISGTTIGLVSACNFTVPLPQKVDRFGLGAGALKAEPIPNDYLLASGDMTMEFNGLQAYNNFRNNTTVVVTLDFLGATIASTFKEELKFVLNATHEVGSSPQIGGPDVTEITFPFEVYDDGTNAPVICTYQSTDTTL